MVKRWCPNNVFGGLMSWQKEGEVLLVSDDVLEEKPHLRVDINQPNAAIPQGLGEFVPQSSDD